MVLEDAPGRWSAYARAGRLFAEDVKKDQKLGEYLTALAGEFRNTPQPVDEVLCESRYVRWLFESCILGEFPDLHGSKPGCVPRRKWSDFCDGIREALAETTPPL